MKLSDQQKKKDINLDRPALTPEGKKALHSTDLFMYGSISMCSVPLHITWLVFRDLDSDWRNKTLNVHHKRQIEAIEWEMISCVSSSLPGEKKKSMESKEKGKLNALPSLLFHSLLDTRATKLKSAFQNVPYTAGFRYPDSRWCFI